MPINPADPSSSGPPRRRRGPWLLAGFLAILALSSTAYFLAGGGKPAKPEGGFGGGRPGSAPIPVGVEAAVQADFPLYLSGLGTVTALHTVTVRSRVDGELMRVAFSEGQLVRAGELLAEIDPRPFQVQLHQAEGQLARDEALLNNAEIDLARYRTLLEQDSIAAQQTVTQESLVRQYRGAVEMDRAQVENARLQLSYTRVTAPVAGRIGLRLVDKGNIVHAADATGLVVITQIQPIAVVFTLPEDDLPKVMDRWRDGKGILVEVYDRGGKTKLAAGQLLAVDNQIDPTTGTVKLKAQFGNEDGRLFSNQFVNVRMRLDVLKAATIVPSAAIQRGTQGTFAYVLQDDKSVSVRPLELGPVDGERTVIQSGLQPGDRVVVDGVDKLREGSAVEVVSRESRKTGKAGEPQPESKADRRAAGEGPHP
jgi:membrane fusion protein, multidrug efflux system